MKKISLALGMLCVLNSAFADHPIETPAIPMMISPPIAYVTMPRQLGYFTLGLEGNYLAITNGNLQYATSVSTTTDVIPLLIDIDSDVDIHEVDPNLRWGWRFDTVYHFPGSGVDIEFAWTHYWATNWNDKSRTLDTVLLGPSLISPIIFTGDPEDSWSTVKGSTKNQYDAVDLVWGQTMMFAPQLALRAFGGVRFTSIHVKSIIESELADKATSVTAANLTAIFKSRFQGIGPRAGVESHIQISRLFSIVGSAGASLLLGVKSQDTSFIFHAVGAGLPLSSHILSHTDYAHAVNTIPELDARVGMNFQFPFNSDVKFNVQVGYDVANYFHVQDGSLLNNTFDITTDSHNFAAYGPYVRLQLDML